MNTAIRLSPSGPVITNGTPQGPFQPGNGARLRLAEATSTISATGNTIPTAPAVIGFTLGANPAIVPALSAPNDGLFYRATVSCDVSNPSTNVIGEVQLYIETRVDGGTPWPQQEA